MELHYVLYASRLVEPMAHDALCKLLETCQRKNAKNALTGFLHIESQIVLQYLEGPSEALQSTIDCIRIDPRHCDFVILADEPLKHRYFEAWQMALVESTTLSLFDLLGVQVRKIPEVTRADPTDLINLLSANASFLRDRPSVSFG